jgi:hypothetical protein
VASILPNKDNMKVHEAVLLMHQIKSSLIKEVKESGERTRSIGLFKRCEKEFNIDLNAKVLTEFGFSIDYFKEHDDYLLANGGHQIYELNVTHQKILNRRVEEEQKRLDRIRQIIKDHEGK